ncbi:MAG TPA: alpha-amylase family glycosyl hydrolase [Candidatus Limnocylindrales bacterium]|nr:alpha-amylase family glycosyl hydrolase [Candidatus Limnocylindrales bacterium]
MPASRFFPVRSTAARRLGALAAAAVLLGGLLPAATAAPVLASHTPAPGSVTIAGSLQSELGCSDDWQPDCAATHLALEAADGIWQGTFAVPAGNWEYKAPLNDSWDENYGLHAQSNGPNIPLGLAANRPVKFYYDHATHWITDNVNSVIVTAPGSFQSELGCSGDWQPDCLRSWLQDPDGDGTYTFETTGLPAGSYEAKAAVNEAWDENYGQGGVPNGPNIAFSVPADNAKVTFSYDAASHVLSILAGHGHDNNIEWDGLRHDSRSDVYRTPGGAVEAGTPVTLRFRTFHDDATAVKVRFYSLRLNGQQIVSMTRAASGVTCYQPGLENETCDYWQATIPAAIANQPDNLWYRFLVTDGSDTDYYGDDTPALDGGLGATTDEVVDQSWALMQYVPDFTAPSWVQDAVIYQIFPDRFRNGRKDNDPQTADVRYDDPVRRLSWSDKPEGYCRNYADGDTNCPWRFDTTPPPDSPTKEQPRGRDYMGGDLKGVDQQLSYLASLGVTAIYFNPIFDAGSNHSYDTQDYTKIDPAFGTQKDFDNLVKHADALGIRIILDGVFNHMSSDSPLFDRYHHYATVGVCESATSAYRSWFTFHDVAAGTGTCVSGTGVANGATYDGWFGFDSIPLLTKSLPAVQAYFLTAPDSIAKRWLAAGASGWRLDVSGDASFPNGYWESFRSIVKAADPDALTVSETWQKDSTLLRMIRGDRLDTTMNYRLRDAVLGLLAPAPFDSKGFADSGHQISVSDFADRLASQREDYPDAAYYSLMNLLDSHDTERLLWTLTPGPETTAGREGTPANVADGKLRQRLASLIQFTVPGAPTVYYGDEVGVTGDDDPDDRRTYPWADLGGSPDASLRAHYTALADLRSGSAALTDGDFRVLLANDADETVAYGRRTAAQAAIVALNRSASSRTLTIPVGGYLPDGTSLDRRFGVGVAASGAVAVAGGTLEVTLPPMSAVVLATGTVDLAPPAAPTNLHVTAEAANQLAVAWNAVAGAAGYDVYVSPLSGGGYVKANDAPVPGTTFTIDDLPNAVPAYVVVRALDAAGNASKASNEASGIPHLVIGWANLQWPPSMSHVISAIDRTDDVYGQVWIDGVTNQPGPTPGLIAQVGFGPDGSNPDGNADWTWVDAAFNVDAGNNDEYVASMLPEATGSYDYAYRYTVTNGRDWVYADLDGIPNGYQVAQAGALTVTSSGDTTAPATPTGLTVTSASPAGIELAWDAIAGDPTLYGYEVLRGDASGGPYARIATTSSPAYMDTNVTEGDEFFYVVRSVDTSFNRSALSAEVAATAELRTVTLTFNLTVPATTDATGRSVYIAGFLDRLDGGLPQWDPGGVVLTRVDATHWTITLTGMESTALEYKYTLGDWEHVEKDAACGEIGNRLLTLSYGANGTQTVSDAALNWRNVAPCGN